VIKGISLSKGVAIGKAYLLDPMKYCILKRKLSDIEVDEEVQRFRDAIDTTKRQMQEIKKRATKVAEKYSVILDTYTLLLEDEILVNDTIDKINNDHMNAEWALTETHSKFARLFNNINDEYLKGKKDDLDLVVHGVMKNLIGHEQETISDISEPVVIVAPSLSPSDTLTMPKNLVLGIATESGGKTSHVGIFASALGIPAVGGVKNITASINSGNNIIIDGIDGIVICNPDELELKHYRQKQKNYRQYEEKLLENIHLPAETVDGHHIGLLANIESANDIKSIQKYGAQGVGLYRTEYLYMGTGNLPSENDLFEDFKKIAEDMAPHPVVIRTLDIGMDKHPGEIKRPNENNPALGLRGIRMSLSDPGIFITQLKAILRASKYGDVRIMYPMVSDVGEIIAAKEILHKVMEEMRNQEVPFNEDIKIGAMIETPAAAICAEHILEEVDFISVGTNDLIQYVLAVDRINENVSHLFQPLHPAVLRLLKIIFSAANKAGKPVAICGELGGDPMATMLINGLGRIDELSMEPHAIPKVKKILRKISLDDAKKMADHALSLSSTKEINHFIISEMQSRFPSDFNRDPIFEEYPFPLPDIANPDNPTESS